MDLPHLDSTTGLLDALRACLGPNGVMTGNEIEPKHLGDWVVKVSPADGPVAVAYPRTTEEVAGVLRACHARSVALVPQGGLTGLAGGATPTPGCVALSMSRMRAIEELDPASSTITVQAGVTMQAIQEAADAAGLLFPLDIGSRGSCAIGGNVSTNAGGVRVLRYGMTRELVRGLEVVLADGTVLTMLNKMQKNNAGYDLKHLFIGAEGTLGVITRVVLRLFPKPASVCTVFLELPDFPAVLDLLARARTGLGGTLSAFEVLWPEFYPYATTAIGKPGPLPGTKAMNVLIEAMGTDQARDEDQFAAVIEGALEAGVVSDAVIAQSGRQTQEIWDIRDSVAEFARVFGPAAGFDVSVPTGRMQEFVDACRAGLNRVDHDVPAMWFGHIADSNMHINVSLRDGGPGKAVIDGIIYGVVREFAGSVSAEHGIGLLKKGFLEYSRTLEEMAVMRGLKGMFDPKGILNVGKIY